jgi:putative nucleotidyltransferase with HDIG domain
VTIAAGSGVGFLEVPLSGLEGDSLPFSLYVDTGGGEPVLYRDARTRFSHEHRRRLVQEGVARLYVARSERADYYRHVEHGLDRVLADAEIPLATRGEILYGVAAELAHELFTAPPDTRCLLRAQTLMRESAGLLVREPQGFAAVRRVLESGAELQQHSLTVAFLSLGVARQMFPGEPARIVDAGLAGLLHDVGCAGGQLDEEDPAHPERGADLLSELGVAPEVCDAVRAHHEQLDGRGFPRGLTGAELPPLARIVGMVNKFEELHTQQHSAIGVFDALRILAQVYRGCFDEQIAQRFVELFRG